MECTNRTGSDGLKLLFLEAPYYYGSGNVVVGQYFPLGIGYLAAYLRESGFEVRIFQPEHQNCFEQELVSYMDSFLPDMVCISMMTPSYPRATAICDLVKSRYRSYTVLGGHHVSAVGEEVLRQSPNTDFAVIGEGEETLLELARELGSDAPYFPRINGLVWRGKDNEIVLNESRDVIRTLDELPFPARDLVDMNKFRIHSYIDFGRKSATMITSRGCPHKCMFCSSWLTMGTR
ncbi:cobalamin-dependent protein, partial [Candidatus Bipolaricaulota bacterium]|nr:cobalamin-dependent protein [Candidatus Bipolaricaulota bacterium]